MYLALLLLSISPLLYGCSFYKNNNQNNTPVYDSTTKPIGSAISSRINIQNFAFSPGALNIKKGTSVTWTNNDSAPHQIKSAIFNSNLLSNGQSFTFTFNEIGTFNYSCSIHPSMLGKIIVE